MTEENLFLIFVNVLLVIIIFLAGLLIGSQLNYPCPKGTIYIEEEKK